MSSSLAIDAGKSFAVLSENVTEHHSRVDYLFYCMYAYNCCKSV